MLHELPGGRFVQRGERVALVDLGDRRGDRGIKRIADNGGCPQHRPRARRQPRELLLFDDDPHPGRHTALVEGVRLADRRSRARAVGARELLQIERIASALAIDRSP